MLSRNVGKQLPHDAALIPQKTADLMNIAPEAENRDPQNPLNKKLGGPPQVVWAFWKREKSRVPAGPFSQQPSNHTNASPSL
jgi:hypothetical protein